MNKFYLLLPILFFLLNSTSGSADPVLEPFDKAVQRFTKGEWVDHFATKKEFDKQAEKMLAFLKKNQKDWRDFLDPKKTLDELSSYREPFKMLPYISRLFTTKPGTLIFQMTDYPNIIVKMDNRPPQAFDESLRSYYGAFEKTQSVQKTFRSNWLFLPYEYGRDSQEVKVKFVFAEKVPLFSGTEIDNSILLRHLLVNAEKNSAIKEKLQTMFKDMLRYICLVDFNDIHIRNMPFTSDGRLAPIDTDSFLAQQGVFSFLREYAAFKIFPTYADVKPVIAESCKTQPIEKFNPYNDLQKQSDLFNDNGKIIEEMRTFFKEKPLANFKIAAAQTISAHVDSAKKDKASVIDRLVAQQLSNDKAHIFGRRCVHVQDFMTDVTSEISKFPEIAGKATLAQLDQEVADILQEVKGKKLIYSFGNSDIYSLKNAEGLKVYICF